MQNLDKLKKELVYAQYEDQDSAVLLEVKIDKIEKAKKMKEQGIDDETIRADVWNHPDEWCQGTCGGYNTWESHNSGLDMCWDCKLEAMD
tara:strand:- start:270 stop:539 length:270 start_codon:yes stop_codon:yes gene_type:complete